MLDIEEFKKKLDKKSRLIGIDPGKKRIGIAISDENKIVATPYKTVIKKDYSNFLSEIKQIVLENNIKGIIVGNPINMDGSSGSSSQSAKDLTSIFKFIEQLNELNTEKVEPLSSILNTPLRLREDKIDDGKIRDKILKNSPKKNEEFFVVPKVIE